MEDFSMLLMDILLSVIIGVVSGLTSSAFWLLLTFLYFKPHIDISGVVRRSSKGGKTYQIKVINRDRSPALNVKAQLYLMINLKAEEGEFTNSIPVALKRSALFQLTGRDPQKKGASVFRFITKTNW